MEVVGGGEAGSMNPVFIGQYFSLERVIDEGLHGLRIRRAVEETPWKSWES
jgi:hypothetical protein